MDNKATTPQEGEWDKIQVYPEKIKFDQDKTVIVTFSKDFVEPKEMPDKKNDGVFYIFECTSEGKSKAIVTSSFTLLRSLKTNMPLSSKTLAITKKNINGKNMFYVETIEQLENREKASSKSEPKEIDTDEIGLDENGIMP